MELRHELPMTTDFDRDKGEAFFLARIERGEDLLAAAARLSIAPAYLGRLERGQESWPDGENSLAADPCTDSKKAPDNLMDFPDMNRSLWLMAIQQDVTDLVYPWWCKDCGWPLSPMGLHFQIEIGEPDA